MYTIQEKQRYIKYLFDIFELILYSCYSSDSKPAYVYELTQEGEDLFPKAYEPALRRLLDILSDQLRAKESEALLRSVGRRLVEERSTQADSAHARLEAAAGVLNELGVSLNSRNETVR